MKISEFINEAGTNGPHSYKEVEMLLNGTKPAAILTPKEMNKLRPYLLKGEFFFRKKPDGIDYIVGQKGEVLRVNRIYQLLKNNSDRAEEISYHAMSKLPNTAYHSELGRLLGYSEEDINYHLNYGELRRQGIPHEKIIKILSESKGEK